MELQIGFKFNARLTTKWARDLVVKTQQLQLIDRFLHQAEWSAKLYQIPCLWETTYL